MPGENQEQAEQKHDERQIVVFKLGKEEFGVDINEVREIIRMEQITKIPNTAEYIEGVINLRGGIIVIIDLARKMGLDAKEVDHNTRIIVIETGKNTVGMIVDSATEVLRLSSDQIEPAPAVITQRINSDYIEGVGILDERLLILLDLAKVLEAKDIENINKVENSSKAAAGASSSPQAESKDPVADEQAEEAVEEESQKPAKKAVKKK